MYLWIFKPSENWAYCGGAAIVIAKTLHEAKKLFHTSDQLYESWDEEDIHEFVTDEKNFKSKDEWNKWVLHEKLSLPDNTTPRVVLINFNWG